MFSRSTRCVILCLVASSWVGACSKPNADEYFKRANDHVSRSSLPEAIIEYRRALQVDPKRGDIREKLADTYAVTGERVRALQEYVRAADLLPDDPTAQLKAGNALLMAGGFEDAKTRARKVLALDPKQVDGQILLGNALAGLKDIDGALAQYQEAVALNPDKNIAYLNIANVQLMKGELGEAEANFKKAVEVAPDSVPARMALANFLWAAGRLPEAEQSLKDAVSLDAANLDANRALGVFYMATNRASEAEPYFRSIARAAKTGAAQIALADYYAMTGRSDDARKELNDLAQKEESYVAASTRLAALDAFEGNVARALAEVTEVLGKYPKDRAARLLNARLLMKHGKGAEALAQAKLIVADEPNSAEATEAYYLIGNIQTGLDHIDEAINTYEEILKRQARPLLADLALAALHLANGSLDKAETYSRQALTIEPKSPQARALLVRVLLAQGKAANAKTELASLQKDFPKSATVLNLAGAQLRADRQFDAARATYTEALRLVPQDLEATAALIELDLATGHPKDAVGRVEAALKTTPPTARFLVLVAQTYAASGDATKAEETLRRAIELEPTRIQAYNLLGQLYIRQNRLDDAKDRFQQVVEQNPKSIPANTTLAMLLEAQHRLPEAEEQYRKVLSLDSHAAVAANNLAWLYAASNRNLDEALQLAQEAQKQLADEPHVNDTLGWIYYQKNLASTAIQHLDTSVRKNPTDPVTHYHLGMAYVRTGELEKAKKELQKALSFKTEFDGAAEARTTLATIGS